MKYAVCLIIGLVIGLVIFDDYHTISVSKKSSDRTFIVNGGGDTSSIEKKYGVTLIPGKDTINIYNADTIVIKYYNPSPITQKNDTTSTFGLSGH